MSIRDFAPSTTAFRQVLTVVVVGAMAAIIAPLGTADRADAHPVQATSLGAVAARPVLPPIRAIIEVSSQPEADAKLFAAHGFLTQAAMRADAAVRAAAKLKAEQEAAAAAQAAAAAAAQAAAEAAAQAAAQAAAHAAAQAAVAAAARAAAGYVQRVWTSGFQNEIDRCRGAVDVTTVYQVRVIAEHSSCGGARFPSSPGSIVTITGLDAGRYRVVGIIARLNGFVDHAEDIPRGYDLLYQTCASGFTDMTFTALQRIG
ncbi:MAG: hypothetical protein V4531_13470 [Actinomycetota bacterium]